MIEQLSALLGVCGYEDSVREYVSSKFPTSKYNKVTDSIGNLFVSENSSSEIAIIAHMDEPGFIIIQITDDGYLKFDTVGKINADSIVNKGVKSETTCGVVSVKAIHLTDKEERKKQLDISKLYIDIGASSKQEAEKHVTVGDYFTFEENFKKLGESYIMGKALNGRIGCLILTEVLKNNKNILGCFTVQREILCRGIKVASYNLNNVKLALCIDYIDINTSQKIVLGDGAVIGISYNASVAEKSLYDKIYLSAQKNKLKIQNIVCTKEDEASVINNMCNDIISIRILIPCRNANTDVCIIEKKDISSVYNLVNMIVKDFENKGDNL